MSEPTNRARRWGDGRVAFLSQKDLFRSLVEAGHPLSSIYADHGAALGISYTQFTRYVRKYLLDAASHRGHQTGRGQGPATALQVPSPATTPSAGPVQRPPARNVESGTGNQSPIINPTDKPKAGSGFHHDPNSGNDRSDLI